MRGGRRRAVIRTGTRAQARRHARRRYLIDELRSGGYRTRSVRRTTPRRVQDGRLSKGDRAWPTRFLAVGEVVRVYTLELALEEPVELRVTRGLLAVLDAEGVGGVARLLAKYLGKLDHVCRL